MRMRSADVIRCWPFDGGIPRMGRDEEDGGLPPMTCRKFRWWSSERARISASSQQRSNRTEPENRCQDFETGGGDDGGEEGGLEDEEDDGAARPTSADGQDDGSSVDGRRRAKFRVPKKRSIVDIFAHAPEVGGDDGGDVAAVQEDNMDKKAKPTTPTKKKMKIKKRKRRKKKVLTSKKGSKKKNGGVGKKVVINRKKSADGENVDVEAGKVKKKKKKMMMVETVMESVLTSTPCAADTKVCNCCATFLRVVLSLCLAHSVMMMASTTIMNMDHCAYKIDFRMSSFAMVVVFTMNICLIFCMEYGLKSASSFLLRLKIFSV